jgi:hypothetical protein
MCTGDLQPVGFYWAIIKLVMIRWRCLMLLRLSTAPSHFYHNHLSSFRVVIAPLQSDEITFHYKKASCSAVLFKAWLLLRDYLLLALTILT